MEIVEWGLDIKSFLDRLETENSVVWFHNLGFDGKFLLDYLLKNGFKHTEYEDEFEENMFMTIINKMNSFYAITVKFATGYSVEFKDSYKKLNMSVRAVAETYDLEISKGDLDYSKPRPVGYIPDEAEIDYLKRDVSIVGQAMLILKVQNMTSITSSADAMREYKEMVGRDEFKTMFPVLSRDWDADLRRAYRGGFTYASPNFRQRHCGAGIALDINSMYPYVMRHMLLPYGEPVWDNDTPEPDDEFPLVINYYLLSGKLKPGHIPCVQIMLAGYFHNVEYSEVFDCEEMALTNVDLALIQKHYDLTILMYLGGYKFRARYGMFDDYIDKWMKIKSENKGGLRAIAKLQLNSLYGKFGTNPDRSGKIPVLNEHGVVDYIDGKEDITDPVYVAMAVFITSYARNMVIREAQKNYDVFAYCDTDSLHLLCDEVPDGMNVHPTELGAWKLEYKFIDSFYVRSKFYLEQVSEINEHEEDCDPDCNHKHNFRSAIAGLPLHIAKQLNFDALYDGNIINGKLAAKRVEGGVVLVDRPYKINFRAGKATPDMVSLDNPEGGKNGNQ